MYTYSSEDEDEDTPMMIEDPLKLLPQRVDLPIEGHNFPNLKAGDVICTPLAATKHSGVSPGSLISCITWECGTLIGQGSFGLVYSGECTETQRQMAVKFIKLEEEQAAQSFLAEVAVLASCTHPNIVMLYGAEDITALNSVQNTTSAKEAETSEKASIANTRLGPIWACFFTEYLDGGSLKDMLDSVGPLPESCIRVYSEQILKGLQYLHDKGIAHGDLKAANILLSGQGCIKLTDFGLTRMTGKGGSGLQGSVAWMAPEVIQQAVNSDEGWMKADIWSFGCTIIEMAEGHPPWNQFSEPAAVLFKVGCTDATPLSPCSLSPAAKAFLGQCLRRNCFERPVLSELLMHIFFQQELL